MLSLKIRLFPISPPPGGGRRPFAALRPARTAILLLLSALLTGCFLPPASPPVTEVLPPAIPLPASDQAISYLGLEPGASAFSLGEVEGELVVFEIIMAQCPHCQREAPKINRLYRMLREAGLAEEVKILAIALGNTALETGLYRERFHVPFPLIPNPDGRLLRVDGTPTLYLVKIGGRDTSHIIYQGIGRLPPAGDLLARIRQALANPPTRQK